MGRYEECWVISDRFLISISEQIETIVAAVRSSLEQIPPELSGDILDRGIILTGGGSLLKDLDVRLKVETKLPVTIADNPLLVVAIGSGKALDDMSILREVAIQ